MSLSEIRELVQKTLRGIGKEAELVGERVILKSGHYVGRLFEFESASAVWLMDADEIKFFDRSGKWLFAIHSSGTQQEVRRAA